MDTMSLYSVHQPLRHPKEKTPIFHGVFRCPVGGYGSPHGDVEGCLSFAVIVHPQEVLSIGVCIHC